MASVSIKVNSVDKTPPGDEGSVDNASAVGDLRTEKAPEENSGASEQMAPDEPRNAGRSHNDRGYGDDYNGQGGRDVPTQEVRGILDITNDGHGFMRPKFRPSDEDVYISASQIRKFMLRPGDDVVGLGRPPKDSERFYGLLQVLSHLAGDRVERVRRLSALLEREVRAARQHEGEDVHRGDLARECLGGRDGDLGAGVHVHAPAAGPRDRRADHVHHAHHLAALELDLLDGAEGVDRLTGLRDGEVQRVSRDDRVTVTKLARDLGAGRDPGERLDRVSIPIPRRKIHVTEHIRRVAPQRVVDDT